MRFLTSQSHSARHVMRGGQRWICPRICGGPQPRIAPQRDRAPSHRRAVEDRRRLEFGEIGEKFFFFLCAASRHPIRMGWAETKEVVLAEKASDMAARASDRWLSTTAIQRGQHQVDERTHLLNQTPTWNELRLSLWSRHRPRERSVIPESAMSDQRRGAAELGAVDEGERCCSR